MCTENLYLEAFLGSVLYVISILTHALLLYLESVLKPEARICLSFNLIA